MTSLDRREDVRLTRPWALGLVVGLLALVVWGLLAGSTVPADTFSDDDYQTDAALYEALAERVADGENYYAAAMEEQPPRGFPTSPAATVREPTVAFVQATLGETGARALLSVLLAVGVLLFLRRLESMTTRRQWFGAVLALTVAVIVPFLGTFVWFHETWGLALILVSLGITDEKRWWPAVLIGCLAPFFRELTLLYVAVRFLLAVRRNRAEAAAWAVGGAAFLGFYAWHVSQVAAFQVADPVSSPGWVDFSGWPFIVDSVWHTTVLYPLPHAVAALVAPLALVGWLFVRGPVALPYAATLFAFIVVFCAIGQPGNIYWGILYAVLLLPGLAFVPTAARSTWRALRAG